MDDVANKQIAAKSIVNMHKFEYFISSFTDSTLDMSIVNKVGRNYFFAGKELQDLRNMIKRDVFSLGIFLGEEKNFFQPSPACIDMISRLHGAEKKKIFINKKAEWLFLCGRAVLEESIAKNPNNLNEGVVLVQNEQDENLGYGLFKQEGKDLVIRNILDKGKYLRMNERRRR